MQGHYNTPGSFVEKYQVDMDDVMSDNPRGGWRKVWFEAPALLVSNPELSKKHELDQRMPVRRIVDRGHRRAVELLGEFISERLALQSSIDGDVP